MINSNFDKLDLYSILNLDNKCSQADIKKSYKKLILIYHPDKNKNINTSEQFIKIKYAYDILNNKKTRDEYDSKNINYKDIFNNKFENLINTLSSVNKSKKIILNLVKNKLINYINFDADVFNIINNNLFDQIPSINYLSMLNINIKLIFTIYNFWNNNPILIDYNRCTRSNFKEYIFPIDNLQNYENEGEILTINENNYYGNFIIKIDIDNKIYNNIKYEIVNNDLYFTINNMISNDIVKFIFLDDKDYQFNLNELKYTEYDFGIIYEIQNFGLPYYDTCENVINISNCIVLRGMLFLILLNNRI